MDQYLTILGSSALSEFRSQGLAKKLGVTQIKGRYVYYIALKEGQKHQKQANYDRHALEELLTYGDEPFQEHPGDGPGASTMFVYPRIGTISPWSSKATSIAQVCGFEKVVKRIERGTIYQITSESEHDKDLAVECLHDRMTHTLSATMPDLGLVFQENAPSPLQIIDIHSRDSDSQQTLQQANKTLGLALSDSEIQYLLKAYSLNGPIARSPTDAELFMFAQVNSEHCRHKQFNASWTVDGVHKPYSLFDMIRNTHQKNPQHVISAYSDNAAVFDGQNGSFFAPDRYTGEWKQTPESVPFIGKVETHNHPTSVSPFEGAATGSGGEIRDEGAVGTGSRPKAGLCGFTVSDLLIPDFQQPWELDYGKPLHIASSLDIMMEAPIGSAAFNNEFGRPCLIGYFRTLLSEISLDDGRKEVRGYHKPIMLAGGIGSVRHQHALKDPGIVQSGSYIIVMGGPAMLIGLGGGAASSAGADSSVELDFASVQRANPEVQRRAQEVINSCVALGSANPIKFIHDVGAGGLSNALPELVHDTGLGATFELREIDNADRGMSPMQIWCNEAQERYVLAVDSDDLNTFKSIADRERCGFSVVGRAEGGKHVENKLVLTDRELTDNPLPIDLPMSTLFGKPPKLSRDVKSRKIHLPAFDKTLTTYLPKLDSGYLEEAVSRVLQLPAVASKTFLVTIGDRTVGGLTCRDQLVGRWQTPLADCSVTSGSLTAGILTGEAMSMGEKPSIALISPAASARMAVAESLMNIAAADIHGGLGRLKLSANWMSAVNHPGEAASIYEAVEAIGMGLCPELGISIPVGKDSMSMKMGWTDSATAEPKEVTAPLSLVITAFAPVADTRNTWTPALRRPEEDGVGETILLFVDLAERKAMGGSAIAQVFGQIGHEAPDVRDVQLLKDYFDAIEQLHESGIVLAYHDISDGGLFTCLVEMAIAGRCGMNVMLDSMCKSTDTADIIPTLFSEELGAVFQVRKSDEINFHRCFATCGPPDGLIKKVGLVPPSSSRDIAIYHRMDLVYRSPIRDLHRIWASTSYQMQRLRDNPECADSEFKSILDTKDPGISYNLTFSPAANILPFAAKLSNRLFLTAKPRVAILREQGSNGHYELAFAFMTAGFAAIDVHMTDLLTGRENLSSFTGLAISGGFSYGDVLGAGQGFAKSILLHAPTRRQFADFFNRKDTFTLGVCNGCQVLSRLKQLIPGATKWPSFQRNTSEQYEARFCMVEVLDNPKAPSAFLHGMASSKFPIAVAHGEGKATFDAPSQTKSAEKLFADNMVSIRYVDNNLQPTEKYPANPNGSPLGIAGITSEDGRVLAMMPHPERCVLNPGSWVPPGKQQEWGGLGPWVRIFQSARRWVG